METYITRRPRHCKSFVSVTSSRSLFHFHIKEVTGPATVVKTELLEPTSTTYERRRYPQLPSFGPESSVFRPVMERHGGSFDTSTLSLHRRTGDSFTGGFVKVRPVSYITYPKRLIQILFVDVKGPSVILRE